MHEILNTVRNRLQLVAWAKAGRSALSILPWFLLLGLTGAIFTRIGGILLFLARPPSGTLLKAPPTPKDIQSRRRSRH